MNIRPSVLAAVIVSLLIPAGSWAATEHGRIRAHVADVGRNSLPGAIIHLEPGNLTVITDREGYFAVPDLEPGAYRIEVSYVGFLTEKQDVRVAANAARVEVKLNLAPSVADEITVSASRPRGEVEALNQRKSSVNVVVGRQSKAHSGSATAPTQDRRCSSLSRMPSR